ncbi:MAG: tetratricopeptide repeat protein, partial [Gammaproteobacteria bacterium]|nr:tetratricopeptide repeat protein [Gammaproteobacteria bacterium]
PSYAAAHLALYFSHLLQNDMASATAAIEAAMQHSYKLPERYQFVMKAAYYRLVKQDIEKTFAVAGMHSELFPDDITAHNMLLILHIQQGEREKAIAAAKRILGLDPGERDMLRLIGELNLDLGRFAEAERYYREYIENAPKDPAGFASLGRMSWLQGEHGPAREHYKKALALEPGNVPVLIELATIEAATGRFQEAEAQLADALAAASTPMQRWQAHDALRGYHERRGEMARAIEDLENAWSELERAQPPVIAFQIKMDDIDTYVRGGRLEKADAIMAALESQLDSPFDLVLSFGYLQLSIELEDAAGIQEALQGMDTLIATLGVEVIRPQALYGRGRLLELQGQCDQAIIAYERALEISPTTFSYNTDIGRCYRKLKRHELAEERLRRVLEIEPYAPLTNLELARAL